MVILESIVSSVDGNGRINLAPMGPAVLSGRLEDPDAEVRFLLRPFRSSRTYQNLIETPRATIHATDDSLLFAQAAIDALSDRQIRQRVDRLRQTDWWPLNDCHRWFAVEIESVGGNDLRSEMPCRVVESETIRPFFGFNRARHAVIEAAILATRTHLISAEQIQAELARLRTLVDKTGGAAEHEAFDLLQVTIDERLAASP